MNVIVVTKRTLYERLGDDPRTQDLLNNKSLAKAHESHKCHLESVRVVMDALAEMGARPRVVKSGEPFDSHDTDWVIAVGGDGTLLSASHYVGGETRLVGINSDPQNSVGYLCLNIMPKDISWALRNSPSTVVTRMEVLLRGKSIAKRVLNEALFTHACPAAMTRFTLDDILQRNSGIWIGTGAGSTGAMRSAGGPIRKFTYKKLQAFIREPYQDDGVKVKTLYRSPSFKLINKTAEAMLYLDGPYLQFPVAFGEAVTFRISKDPLRLVK